MDPAARTLIELRTALPHSRVTGRRTHHDYGRRTAGDRFFVASADLPDHRFLPLAGPSAAASSNATSSNAASSNATSSNAASSTPGSTTGRPGDALAQLLAHTGAAGCGGCSATQLKMNTLGPAGCREHLDELANEILANARAHPSLIGRIALLTPDLPLLAAIRAALRTAIDKSTTNT